MRFYMVDRITELKKGVSVKGLKNVSVAEEFFHDTSPNGPVFPAPLLIETLAQLGVWFMAASSEFEKRAVLLSLGEVNFHRPVRPGDRLLLEDWIETQTDEAAVISGRVMVGDEVVMEMKECMCAIVPTGNLEDKAHTRMMFEWLTWLNSAAGN